MKKNKLTGIYPISPNYIYSDDDYLEKCFVVISSGINIFQFRTPYISARKSIYGPADHIFLVGSPYMDRQSVRFRKKSLYMDPVYFINRGIFFFRFHTLLTGREGVLTEGAVIIEVRDSPHGIFGSWV